MKDSPDYRIGKHQCFHTINKAMLKQTRSHLEMRRTRPGKMGAASVAAQSRRLCRITPFLSSPASPHPIERDGTSLRMDQDSCVRAMIYWHAARKKRKCASQMVLSEV